MNIPEMPFRTPVNIRLPNGLDHTFHNVYDALDFLGERYDRAVHRCRAALKRIAPVEIAREAFTAACLEAGMPMVVVAAGTSSSAKAPPMPVSA